jgi:dimethylargininase
VVEVPVTKVLDLKSGVTALPDGTIVGYQPLVDNTSLFPRFLSIPESHGCAVVVLDPTSVIMSAEALERLRSLQQRGLTVVTTPVTEFERLEGRVTCLSVRLREYSRQQ